MRWTWFYFMVLCLRPSNQYRTILMTTIHTCTRIWQKIQRDSRVWPSSLSSPFSSLQQDGECREEHCLIVLPGHTQYTIKFVSIHFDNVIPQQTSSTQPTDTSSSSTILLHCCSIVIFLRWKFFSLFHSSIPTVFTTHLKT